jgi:hypothetical protein
MFLKCFICRLLQTTRNRITFDISIPNPASQFSELRIAKLSDRRFDFLNRAHFKNARMGGTNRKPQLFG